MNIRLRKVTEHDDRMIVNWRNRNAEFFPPQEPLSLSSHLVWYFNTYAYDPSDHYFIVTADGASVGTIAINTSTFEIGRVLLGDKNYARTGVMTEALRLLIEAHYAGYYWLQVLRNNERAIAFYERNGFFATKELNGMLKMERT